MRLIKNFDSLAINDDRKKVLELVETAIESIQPENILKINFFLEGNILKVDGNSLDLNNFERVFLIGIGKGSAKISQIIENTLGDFLNEGYVIDVKQEAFKKIEFILGTHPLPSEDNLNFTQKVIDNLHNLTDKDLVLVVICGGGSVMFEDPFSIDLNKITNVNKILLRSGANISEMNTLRKHLSLVKGGGLAKNLFPAKIVSLLFSDVPGNDLSVIASGPTVKDQTTKDDALKIIEKYHIDKHAKIKPEDLLETPKDDKYFANVDNILILSNQTALDAMMYKARELGLKSLLYSASIQGDANKIGKTLIDNTPLGSVLIAGGETTVIVKGKGLGGRNQQLALACLPFVSDSTIVCSFDSDGWDNSHFAGAIVDKYTLEKSKKLDENPDKYLNNNNSLLFFEKIEDGIDTGKLSSNISDLMIVYKKAL